MEDRLAKYTSIITSPYITAPISGLWIIGVYSPNIKTFFIWSITFIVCVVLFPFFYIYKQIQSGSITDIHVAKREQRVKPSIFAICGSVLLIVLFYFEHTPKVLIVLALLLFINGCIFLLIALYSKVSIHVAAYVGSILIISRLINHSLIYLLLVFPLIVWARRRRERHTLWQSFSAASICMFSVFNL